MLQLNVHGKGKYQVVRINQTIDRETDVSELNSVINWLLERGKRSIAIHFTPKSLFGPNSISLFTECMERVFQARGKLAVINPGGYLSDYINTVDFDHSTEIYASEKELVPERVPA